MLDTCCGLGYTAIGAARLRARGVERVVTIELDDVALEMCAHNPWSRELFGDAARARGDAEARAPIEVLRGDASAVVRALADGAFGCVIHDPPARALCKEGDLYGARFYGELRRVLRPGGTLFHYVGNPESKEGGRLFGGVRERLAEAGFASIATAKDAFGITAKAP